jgi:hypothetical protein
MVNSKTAICRVLQILVTKEEELLKIEKIKGTLRLLMEVMVFDLDQVENKQVSITILNSYLLII